MNIKLIQANSVDAFDKLCQAAIEDGFMFVGQVLLSGLGKGEFMYTQQWAKGTEDVLSDDKPKD